MDNQKHDITDSSSEFQEERSIPVVEEQLHVKKEETESKVYITKQVQEEEATVEVPLQHDKVNVERITIDQYVEEYPTVRYEGDKIIIPVVQEEVIVEKKIRLVEEVHIDREHYQENFSETFTLKKEIIEVTRDNTDDANVGISDNK